MDTNKRLYRSRTHHTLAGVLGGLAEYTHTDPTIWRVGFVIFCLLPGPGVIFYLVAWLIMPLEPKA
jgi:phage shock protein C